MANANGEKIFSIWPPGKLGDVIALLCPDFVLSCRVLSRREVGQLIESCPIQA